MVLDAQKARVVSLEADGSARPLADNLVFANGITLLENGTVVIAETRAERLTLKSTDGYTASIPAPGAPDNLSAIGDRVIAALIPNLLTFALYRYGFLDAAPSHIAAWDQQTGWQSLYEDQNGTQFSGVTVGVMPRNDILIAGSIQDAGVLVCQTGGLS